MSLDPLVLRQAAAHLQRADPVLGALVAAQGDCRLKVDRRGSAYSALLEAILYQQITGKAAAAIHRRLAERVGCRHPRPAQIEALSRAALRRVGLSRQKVAYMRDLTARVQDGLPLGRLARLPDEDVIEALTHVKGIGRWTAEMFLIFRLGRLDVLPVSDYGVRKAMQRAYRKRELPQAAWIQRVAEPWRPYRSAACWYLWRSLEAGGLKT
jgi:3-methyladenine DNA glycosylase/8-oxoguanine DNA glycosylase